MLGWNLIYVIKERPGTSLNQADELFLDFHAGLVTPGRLNVDPFIFRLEVINPLGIYYTGTNIFTDATHAGSKLDCHLVGTVLAHNGDRPAALLNVKLPIMYYFGFWSIRRTFSIRADENAVSKSRVTSVLI